MFEHEQVIELNNKGVFLLMAGEDAKAICRLRDSLAVLKSAVCCDSTSSNEDPAISILRQSSVFSIGLSRLSHENVLTAHGRSADATKANCEPPRPSHIPVPVCLPGLQQDSQPYVYCSPFTFNANLSFRDLDCLLHAHSAVVIFNMALAHHRLGKLTRKQAFLEKAILFYDMCLELLENCDSSTGNARLIELASLNNASLLRIEFGEHALARRGLNLLSTLLVGADSSILAILKDEDVRGFLLNITLMQPVFPAAAA